MKVVDVMTRHVEFIGADATAQDAASLMGELDVSALPIGSPQDLKGVVTDRDLLYRVVAEGKDPKRTRVSEVATKLVFTCRPDDPLTTAMDLMASHNIRRLPVVADEGVVGWLTLSDVSRRLLVDSQVVQDGLKGLTNILDITDAAPARPPAVTFEPRSTGELSPMDGTADRGSP